MPPTPGPERQLDDDEILSYISEAYGPAVGTSDVAGYFEVETQTAKNYLDRLADEGYVNTRKVGRARIWWLTDAGDLRASIDQPSDSQ